MGVTNHLLTGMILQVYCVYKPTGEVLLDLLPTHSMANQPTPPNVPPLEIAGLMIRAYENPLVSLNKAGWLLNPYQTEGGLVD